MDNVYNFRNYDFSRNLYLVYTMISVITTAYNHEKTLQRAIDSVQMQKGVYIQHIVIDDTLTNRGMMETYFEAFKQCKGEYIAFCDGDDFWTNSYKLKRQFDYMESNPDCGFCIHKVNTLIVDRFYSGNMDSDFINQRITFDNLLKGNAHVHAQSYFIRKSVFDKYIDFEKFIRLGFKLWDYPIVLELVRRTRFHHLNFWGAVYVKNEESVTNTKSRLKRFKYVLSQYKIKSYFVLTYGCKFTTLLYLAYRMVRNAYSIIFKRWT